MGCVASKKDKVCRNCHEPLASLPRSYSMHVHHLPQSQGDTYHVVALTSTTLGSLKLDSFDQNHPLVNARTDSALSPSPTSRTDDIYWVKKNKDFGVKEAKMWSKMIDEKIPKVDPRTSIRTPPGEPDTINAWELMEGLEDISPLRRNHDFRNFSCSVAPNSVRSSVDVHTPIVQENGSKQLWLELAEKNDLRSNSNSTTTAVVSDFDPDVINEFRKSLEELPPVNPFQLKPFFQSNNEAMDVMVLKDLNCYDHEVMAKEKVFLYFTSLRGVRKTYEDCSHVRVILKGLNVKVDERDVSMHSRFKEELKELLGEGFGLPRVFVGKKYIGGAEEMRRMNENGQLEKVLEGCETVDDSGGGRRGGGVCEGCGDVRFMPCETCSGSCKIYYEADYDAEEEQSEEGGCGFQRCPHCNENGLVRCPVCCD